jgi:hypothetical protein
MSTEKPKQPLTLATLKAELDALRSPQGSGQNRPCGVTSKPAIWDGPGRDPFYPAFS